MVLRSRWPGAVYPRKAATTDATTRAISAFRMFMSSHWHFSLFRKLRQYAFTALDRKMTTIPRGKYIGEAVDPPADEAEHFYKCEACGAWVDCRDLGMVFDHEAPLPHPDRGQ
jgi:hypothetical protein